MELNCRIMDLRYKEVINIPTGERLGYPRDVEINMKTGALTAIVVPGTLRFFGLLGRMPDVVIPWENIDKIGDDIILVNYTEAKTEKK